MSELTTSSRNDRREAAQYLRAIRQHWLLIAVLVVATVGSALVFVTATAKRFEATADIAVTPVSASDDTFQGVSVFRNAADGSSTVVTAARVFNSPQIRVPARRAMQAAGIASSSSISVNPLSQADIVAVTATAPTALQAARATNIFAQTVVKMRTARFQNDVLQQLARIKGRMAVIPVAQRATNFEYSALAQRAGVLTSLVGAPDPTLSIVAPATPPMGATWPRTKLTLAAALLASLLIGCGVAVLLEVTNPRVSNEDDLQLSQRLPILARIPRLSARVAHGYLLGQKQLPGAAWKGYRTLRAVLPTAGADGSFPRSILVTSATPGDGKTMTAVNLAITLASSDMRVILVDADLHRPMVATFFQVATRGDGFINVVSGRVPVEAALTPAPAHHSLKLLLSRREHAAQGHLLERSRIQHAIARLTEAADVVVIDSPPLPEVAEALELAAAVDTVLLAVRLGHTRRDKLEQLREMLAQRGVSPIGFVVTTRRGARADSEYGYNGDVVSPRAHSLETEPGSREVLRLPSRSADRA